MGPWGRPYLSAEGEESFFLSAEDAEGAESFFLSAEDAEGAESFFLSAEGAGILFCCGGFCRMYCEASCRL